MSRTTYPQDSDIQSFVTNAGLVVPSGFTFTGYGAAASAEWEERTGWQPFLQDASATARIYNPPGDRPTNRDWQNNQYGGARILNLYAGIANAAALTSVVCSGVTKVNGVDFFMAPINAPNIGRPYTRIEFVYPFWGLQNCITVTAQWGWGAILPEDVWQAVLRIGARIAAEDMLEGTVSTPDTIKVGDEMIKQDQYDTLSQTWAKAVSRTIKRYMFTGVGIVQ